MMHISDLHTPEIFFSIDSNNLDEVRAEINTMEEYMNSLPSDFNGNIMYFLSMRYVDLCIEKIYKWFDESGLLNSMMFVVTADHGSSFGLYPLRTTLVNNEHDENYHIPCIFSSKEIVYAMDENYYTTKDIVKTLLKYAKIDNKNYTGVDILNNKTKSSYSISEYLGSGCPDIVRKQIILVIRDKKYCVGIKQKINEPFLQDNIFCVYDKLKDKLECENIVDKIEFDKIDYLIEILKIRIKSIKESYCLQYNTEELNYDRN
jgi:hypothetical protein